MNPRQIIKSNEFSEAKMYCNIKDPTSWQMKRVISYYVRIMKGKRVRITDGTDEELRRGFEVAKKFFKEIDLL